MEKGFSPPLYFACMECVGVVNGRARVVQLRTSPRNQGSGLVKNGHVIQFAAPVSWGAGGTNRVHTLTQVSAAGAIRSPREHGGEGGK